MKLFLILFLVANTAQALTCSMKNVKRFELCQLEDYLSETILKVYPTMKQVTPKRYAKLLEKTGKFAIDEEGTILSLTPLLGLEENFQEWKVVEMEKLVWHERVYAVKHLGFGMKECGLSQANTATLLKRLHKNKKVAKIECLEAASLVQAEKVAARKVKEDAKEVAREYLRNYNCNKLTVKFQKNLCILYSEK